MSSNSITPTTNDDRLTEIRSDFPFLRQHHHGSSPIYFDNAATTQKPQQVIQSVADYYAHHCGSAGRSIHTLSEASATALREARRKVARFINADEDEIIFTSNATAGINLVSRSLRPPGDVVTTVAEHHSNMLPWMQTRNVKILPVDEAGCLDLSHTQKTIRDKPAIVALSHVSNVFGLINPIHEIIQTARQHNVLSLVDAAQSAPHLSIDVKELDCDFLVFSGHKMLAPAGIGVLYVRSESVNQLRMADVGGGTVTSVHQDDFTPADGPARFEPGTPNVEGAVALGAAIDYLRKLGQTNVLRHSQQLASYAIEGLQRLADVKIVGDPASDQRLSTVSFELKRMNALTVAKVLNGRANVMIRSGYHCAQPLHEHLRLGATARASFYVYNTRDEIEAMIDVLMSLNRLI